MKTYNLNFLKSTLLTALICWCFGLGLTFLLNFESIPFLIVGWLNYIAGALGIYFLSLNYFFNKKSERKGREL